MEDKVSTLTTELEKVQEELEKSKSTQEASVIDHQRIIEQRTVRVFYVGVDTPVYCI